MEMGQSVILDSVAGFERIRAQWREIAAKYGAEWRVIECVCADEAVHQTRLHGRAGIRSTTIRNAHQRQLEMREKSASSNALLIF